VDAADGRRLRTPFTVTPGGQPDRQPATLTLDIWPVRPIDNEEALEDLTFYGGILRLADDDDEDRILWCVPLWLFEDDSIQAALVVAGGFLFACGEMPSFNRLQPARASAACTTSALRYDDEVILDGAGVRSRLVRDDRDEFKKTHSVTAHAIHGPGELKYRDVFEPGIRIGDWRGREVTEHHEREVG
jgi:hypothetical protein